MGNIPGQEAAVSQLFIAQLCQQLIELARQRVHSGEISERGLARKAGISQPHMHNVLKGIRVLSPDSADRLMRALDISIPQILWSAKVAGASRIVPVPLLRHRIGPGTAASFNVFQGLMPFSGNLAANMVEPLCGYLSPDLALPAACRPGDLVLLDRDPVLRQALNPGTCWIVAETGGLRVRYVRRAGKTIEVGSEPDGVGSELRHWQPIPLQGRSILDIVRARIVWIGREMETPPEGSPGPTGTGD